MLSVTPGARREYLVTLVSTWGSLTELIRTPCRATAQKSIFTNVWSPNLRVVLTLSHVCLQAAELVSENCEAYEAHMRDIRDYLEERLEVRGGV